MRKVLCWVLLGLTLLGLLPALAEAALDTGSTGEEVCAVQRLLYIQGFLSEAPDGVFGKRTKQAVKDYMAVMSADFASRERLHESAPRPSVIYPEDGGMPCVVDVKRVTAESVQTDGRVTADWLDYMLSGAAPAVERLAQGDRGDAVKRMQRRLYALGYLAAGVDGVFGGNTRLALSYFQRRSGLTETGLLDEATGRRLYSEDAVASDQVVSPYKALVSTKRNRVRILRWTGEGYGEIAKEFVCTTGATATPTIRGTFQAVGPAGEWYNMKDSNCWVRYAFRIKGGYMFHSVLFSRKGAERPTGSSLRNLGKNASHGCIRLAVEDVKWIYENCAAGMTVIIE